MRIKRLPSIFFVVIVAFVTALAVVPASSFVLGVDVAHDGPAGTNDPDYWENRRPTPLPASTGEECVKEDSSGGQWSGDTFTATSAYSQIVLKYATTNRPFYDVEVGDVLVTGTNQDISHVILCTGGSSTTTTTDAPTTTTDAPTTTTVAPTTTTVATEVLGEVEVADPADPVVSDATFAG